MIQFGLSSQEVLISREQLSGHRFSEQGCTGFRTHLPDKFGDPHTASVISGMAPSEKYMAQRPLYTYRMEK